MSAYVFEERKLKENERRKLCPKCGAEFVLEFLVDIIKCNKCGYINRKI